MPGSPERGQASKCLFCVWGGHWIGDPGSHTCSPTKLIAPEMKWRSRCSNGHAVTDRPSKEPHSGVLAPGFSRRHFRQRKKSGSRKCCWQKSSSGCFAYRLSIESCWATLQSYERRRTAGFHSSSFAGLGRNRRYFDRRARAVSACPLHCAFRSAVALPAARSNATKHVPYSRPCCFHRP